MTTVVILNRGPGPIVVFDAEGTRTDMGENASSTFTTPVSVTGAAPAAAPAEPEAPASTPGGAVVLTDADAAADLAGTPRPDNPTVFDKAPEEYQAQADAELAPAT